MSESKQKVRYAVVGLGWIAQEAVLPAFANADENSVLTALVSDSPEKLAELSEQYGVENTYSYDEYDACLASGKIDAVYIALPNNLHMDFTIRALRAGVHVLCEKPMAMDTKECQAMLTASSTYGAQIMIAYRLHFEEANLKASALAQAGDIGEPRFFTAMNMQDVEAGNIRLDRELGGGPLEDLGIYCINAARYIFRSEPIEVSAFAESRPDPRFEEVPEMVTAVLRFPNNRLAMISCGFGESKISSYQVVGTKGDLKVDPAFTFSGDLKHALTIDEKTEETVFEARDHFAPLLVQFSSSILNKTSSEPSGDEGLVDMIIIDAIRHSIESGKAVKIDVPQRIYRPTLSQEMHYPPVEKQELTHAEAPGGS